MKKALINGQTYSFPLAGIWSGPDTYIVKGLNERTRELGETLGPSVGDYRSYLFSRVIRFFDGIDIFNDEIIDQTPKVH